MPKKFPCSDKSHQLTKIFATYPIRSWLGKLCTLSQSPNFKPPMDGSNFYEISTGLFVPRQWGSFSFGSKTNTQTKKPTPTHTQPLESRGDKTHRQESPAKPVWVAVNYLLSCFHPAPTIHLFLQFTSTKAKRTHKFLICKLFRSIINNQESSNCLLALEPFNYIVCGLLCSVVVNI